MAWYRCYFPDMDGQDAVNLLKDSTEGSFLIRPSSSNQSDSGNQVYTLTAKSASQVVHTRIQFNGEGYGKDKIYIKPRCSLFVSPNGAPRFNLGVYKNTVRETSRMFFL